MYTEMKFYKYDAGHMTKMTDMPIYGKKNLLLRNQSNDFHETWYVASGTPFHHSLQVHMMTLVDVDLFYGNVKFCNTGFCIGKIKTVDFPETIVSCDLKFARCRQLIE